MYKNHQSNEFNKNECVICRRGFEKPSDQVKVTRGLANLIKFSELHSRHEIHEYLLHQSNKVPPGQVLLRDECYSLFADYKRLNNINQGQALYSPKKEKLRSASGGLNSTKTMLYLMGDILIKIKIQELYEQFHCVTICSQRVMIVSMLSECRDRLDS